MKFKAWFTTIALLILSGIFLEIVVRTYSTIAISPLVFTQEFRIKDSNCWHLWIQRQLNQADHGGPNFFGQRSVYVDSLFLNVLVIGIRETTIHLEGVQGFCTSSCLFQMFM